LSDGQDPHTHALGDPAAQQVGVDGMRSINRALFIDADEEQGLG
jgi:hypothetical protein